MSNMDAFNKDLASQLKGKVHSIKPVSDYVPLVEYIADSKISVWAGYFGARPTLKYIVKKFGQVMR